MLKAGHCAWSVLAIGVLACGAVDDGGTGYEPTNLQTEEATSCTIPSFVSGTPKPIGWAAQNGGTTGGGSATPVVVTTLSAFNAAAKGSTAKVIYVNGNLAQGTATIGSNTTVIGCSGTNPTLNGHVDVKGVSNVIIRNMNIVGYNCAPPDVNTATGGQCQNGHDALTVDSGAHNVWFDHDAVRDGSDGNLDIVHGSDFITISYTKFYYSTKRTDPNDTGAAGHRYSNLIGGSDSNGSQDSGHLNITFHHDWWGQFVVERQPRVRFGKVHLFNNLWTSSGNNYCIGVGVGANILSQNNAFVGVKTPINTTSYVNASIAKSSAKSTGNLYQSTSGSSPADLNASSVFTPPYSFTLESASAVQADVQANAGPK